MHAVRSALVVGLLATFAFAGCAGASASPSPSTAPPTDPPPTAVPGGRSADPSDPGSGGGGGGVDPAPPGNNQLSVPKPGTLNPHPVSIETLEAQIDGRRVVILATWWSGVEPCYQLDSVNVKRDGNDFTIQLIEGNGPGDQVCIEIAQEHATAVDLGELEPGDYTVAAQDGPAAAISFTID